MCLPLPPNAVEILRQQNRPVKRGLYLHVSPAFPFRHKCIPEIGQAIGDEVSLLFLLFIVYVRDD